MTTVPMSFSETTVNRPTTTTATDFPDPAAVTQALAQKGVACENATPVSLTDADRTYVQTATTCTVDGEQVVVATFGNAQERATYETIGESGRGAYPHWVLRTTWAVATFKRATADRIAAVIGGTAH
jgi:hypothetical protein